MALAIVLILLVVGSVLFHFLSPWYFTPIASNWRAMDDTISLTLWVTGFVFVAVNLFMAYAVIRYRHRKGARAKYEPENKKLEWWLTGVTAAGVVAMLAPGLFVWAKFVNVPEDAAVVEAMGQQWHWSYRFPGKDGALGTVDARHISDKNPFGLNPDDPNGQDDVLVASPSYIFPSAHRSRCCSAPRTFCTTLRWRSSGSKWIWCRAWSPTSGLPPPAPENSTSSAKNCVASRISPCVAASWWRKRPLFRRG